MHVLAQPTSWLRAVFPSFPFHWLTRLRFSYGGYRVETVPAPKPRIGSCPRRHRFRLPGGSRRRILELAVISRLLQNCKVVPFPRSSAVQEVVVFAHKRPRQSPTRGFGSRQVVGNRSSPGSFIYQIHPAPAHELSEGATDRAGVETDVAQLGLALPPANTAKRFLGLTPLALAWPRALLLASVISMACSGRQANPPTWYAALAKSE